jgi:predicted HD phosphohydrolase
MVLSPKPSAAGGQNVSAYKVTACGHPLQAAFAATVGGPVMRNMAASIL